MPLFSIITPTYNRALIIEKTIQSVLSQTFSDFELIIIDDGSTDNTRQIIKSYNDPRIVYQYQENKGVCAARNFGILISKGKYITFLDSDDLVLPEWLYHFSKLISSKLNDLIFCDVEIKKGEISTHIKADYPYHNQYSTAGLFLAGAFLISKKFIHEIGLFDENVKYGEFTELGFRCNKQGYSSLFTHNKGLIYNQSLNGGAVNWENRLHSNLYTLDKHEEYFNKSSENKQVYLGVAAFAACQLGQFQLAAKLFRKSFLAYPYKFKPLVRFIFSMDPRLLKIYFKI